MKKLESTLPNMVIVLTGVTLVAAALLGVMQQLTKDPIAKIEEQTLNDGIKKVILAGQDGDLTVTNTETIENENGKFTVYTAAVGGEVVGKAVKTAVTGFSPNLTVLTGFDNQGNILGYEILNTAETPGLGAKAGEWFQKGGKGNIIGMNPGTNNMTVSKDGGEVDAITASTITSRAFLKAVNIEYNAIFSGAATEANTGATAVADTTAAAVDSVAGAVADTIADETAELRAVVD